MSRLADGRRGLKRGVPEMESIIIIGIIVLIIILRSPTAKGKIGESSASYKLNRLGEGYVVLNNIVISSYGQKTTQIDHIVVSIYGIFVIETKNYKGWIYGSEYKEYWLQTFPKRKYEFYNPIKQNELHVRALRKIVGDRIE